MSAFINVLSHACMITVFVFVMMMIVDYVNVLTRGNMETLVKGGQWRQYTIASFLGATPGCLGAFMNVSFYAHGLLSFGAVVGGMIATSGDESFVMLALFPKEALLLFALLFVFSIVCARVADAVAARLGIQRCEQCDLQVVHEEEECQCIEPGILFRLSKHSRIRYLMLLGLVISVLAVVQGYIGPPDWNWIRITLLLSFTVAIWILSTVPDHFLDVHIWQHLIQEHLWRVFLWTFFALLFTTVGMAHWNLEALVTAHLPWVFVICALTGVIPESGPHLVFVMLFANGVVPFSILLTSSIVQDGHGMLPLFSYSLKNALLVKVFNLAFGILLGLPLLSLGY
jgi:hypothetical protein